MKDIVRLLHLTLKGGQGSGNFGHSGVPGRVGGSSSTGGFSSSNGLIQADKFPSKETGSKALLTQDGKIIAMEDKSWNTHTQMYARMALDNPNDFSGMVLEKARNAIKQDEERADLESKVGKQYGLASLEVNFMGDLDIVMDTNEKVTPELIKSTIKRIHKAILKGTIDYPKAKDIVITINDKNVRIPYFQIGEISRVTIDSREVTLHYKSLAKDLKKIII